MFDLLLQLMELGLGFYYFVLLLLQ